MNERIPAEVFPPGDFIREELEERGWTQADLANILGRPASLVNDIIKGKRSIGPDIARALAEAFGTSAGYWLGLESAYRLSRSENATGSIRRMAELYEQAPVKEMQRRHWIKPARSAEELESELRRFWGQALAFRVAARANAGPGYALTPSQYTWCRQALRLSSGVGVRTYSKEALKTSILALRALASYPEEVRKVPRALADMGIRFLVVEHLPRSLIDGAALWRSDGAPVVALSLRFARIDSFWHTLCHELAHILSEDNQNWLDIDLIGSKATQKTNQELVEAHANRMAADMLIPQDKLNGFIARKRPYFYKEDIKGFAKIMGVHPGIVVGQLQFRGIIPYSANREMLVDVRNIVIQSALTDGWGHTITDN